MHEGEASDGVVTTNMTNIDTAITAKGMGLLRITDTVFASAEVSLLLKATS
jgi:predicted metal-dependent phosphoesterase TrpH